MIFLALVPSQKEKKVIPEPRIYTSNCLCCGQMITGDFVTEKGSFAYCKPCRSTDLDCCGC